MAKGRLSRRDFLMMAGAGTAGALLAACAPQEVVVTKEVEVPVEVTREVEVEKEVPVEVEKEVPVEVTAAPEAVVIDLLWDNWGDFFNNLMTPIGESYTADVAPNVTVQWTFSPDWHQSLLTAIASGDAPDATFLRTHNSASLAYQGALLPLDAYMVQTGLVREDFILAHYDVCLWEGKLYGLPGGSDWNGIYYNIDLLEEAGISEPPKTVYELIDQSMQVLEKDASGAITRLGYSPGSGHLRDHWGYVFGGEWYDEKEQKITADHPGIVECLEWIKDYVDELDVSQLIAFDESLPGFWSPGNSFASKKTAFRLDGFWTLEAMDEFAPDVNYGVVVLPTLEGKPEEMANNAVAGWNVGIPSISKQPDEAWAFLNYGWVENAWKMGCDTVNGPAVIDQLPAFEECYLDRIGSDNRMTPYFHVWTDMAKAATKFWPAIPVNQLLADEVDRAYDFFVRGEKGIDEALQEVNDTVQPELDKILS